MASSREYHGNIHAPEFPIDVEWVNTDRKLSLAALRGKLVLLDFWTYGCINCMHILPDLRRLERQYPNELVVIGVHSAKFANEADSANIRRIIARYEISHPVVNDRNMVIWEQYGVHAWPTTVLIDPMGRVLAAHSGEGVYSAFEGVIREAVAQYTRENKLQKEAPVTLRSMPGINKLLLFPGKIIVNPSSEQLLIADSGHNRVVITNLEGVIQEIIGSGEAALQDGSYEQAAFNKPQGLAFQGAFVYVADTNNHALRRIDLVSRQVSTLAGDGELSYHIPEGPATEVRLNSPWDLQLNDGNLYIAMAGTHQIYLYDTISRSIRLFAGSGREALTDGDLLHAGFAQPSGLASDGQVLYVADSEASAIRAIDLQTTRRVRTLIGAGLFDFGDIDGDLEKARLQHALGVALAGRQLYIADTYNHKIKVLDLASGVVRTYLGSSAGFRDGQNAAFHEPGGLAYWHNKLYVADTNNHAVRVIDLASKTVSTLTIIPQLSKVESSAI
ncbi:MAG: thioredoxin-like domain-containing protein [Anaerolineae bacterium]